MLKSPLPPDVTVTDRLQTVISEWKGAQDGHKLERLYQDCLDLVGQDRLLLPARIIPVKDLDSDRLAYALRHTHLPLEYYLDTVGRFEAALVPIVRTDRRADSFLFVYEENLSVKDQVGLFAHAVGHLILNQQQRLLERDMPLDPDDGQIHTDRLDVLRYLDISENRNLLDRKVLEAFPKLAHLIEPPEDTQVTLNQAARDLEPFLRRQGWVNQFIRTSYKYTRGRVIPNSTRLGRAQVIDALLRAAPVALPIAAVHVQRADEEEAAAIARARSAAQQLSVPFAYVLTRKKEIIELHWLTGSLSDPRLLTDLPTREELRSRWFAALQLTKQKEIDALLRAYQPDKLPYYYQEAAINQAIIATLQARNGLRGRRILLTLATGTGKTQVAFQILWKLRQTQQVNNVLFLADRGYLLEQAQANTFGPFNDAIARGMGEIDTVHHMVFGTYQWLANGPSGQERYRGYPSDYFDVIIIDECHRGSATENSDWRKVLEHFSQAVQIGLTATPLETRDVQTNKYFGPSVYTYTLSQGINDGYLAPYSVRYIQIERDGQNNLAQKTLPDEPLETLDQQIVTQTSETIRQYTSTIAEHLAHYLQQQEKPRDNKTIVFCVDNDHADKMRLALIESCAAWARPGDIVRIVDDDGTEGKRALNLFCASSEPQPMIVTTARLLTTGIDAPTCKNIVLARGVGSMVEFKQIIGRGTRIFLPQKGWFTILDYAGAIKHFFDAKFDGDPASMQREFLLPPAPVPAAENQTIEAVPIAPTANGATDQEQQPALPIAQPTPIASAQNTNYTTAPDHVPTPRTVNEPNDYAASVQAPEADLFASTSLPSSADQPASEPQYAPAEATNDAAPSAPPAATTASTESSPRPIAETPRETARPPRVRATRKPAPGTQPPDPQDLLIVKKPDGDRFIISREAYFELDPSARNLREGTVSDFTQQALKDMIRTPDDLRQHWTDKAERKLLIDQLTNEAVALDSLANALHMPDVDHFDLLLYVLFQQPAITRQQRVERLRREHSAFFARFADAPLANDFLNAILTIYVQEQDIDIRDLGLLRIAPLSSRTSKEWNRFLMQSPNRAGIQDTLQELQRLLYQ